MRLSILHSDKLIHLLIRSNQPKLFYKYCIKIYVASDRPEKQWVRVEPSSWCHPDQTRNAHRPRPSKHVYIIHLCIHFIIIEKSIVDTLLKIAAECFNWRFFLIFDQPSSPPFGNRWGSSPDGRRRHGILRSLRDVTAFTGESSGCPRTHPIVQILSQGYPTIFKLIFLVNFHFIL